MILCRPVKKRAILMAFSSRFCATVGEEEGVDVPCCNLGELGAETSAGLGGYINGLA